jgi:hypothetical protein
MKLEHSKTFRSAKFSLSLSLSLSLSHTHTHTHTLTLIHIDLRKKIKVQAQSSNIISYIRNTYNSLIRRQITQIEIE